MLESDKNIKAIIDKMPNIPSMPPVIAQALSIMENPKSNVNQLSVIISKDIGLTTEILKLVNSSYYGLPTQITTINRAMALLGMNKVRNIVLSIAVKPMMMSQSGKSLWEHSIRCGIACQLISKSLGTLDEDEAFVMGLLHDIGKTILNLYNKDACLEISKLVQLGADILVAEKMIFGFTHTEIGVELIHRWKLPVIIGSCIKHHHKPQDSDNLLVDGAVYVADKISQEYFKYPILDPDIVELLDFEIPDPLVLREEVFAKSKPMINILTK